MNTNIFADKINASTNKRDLNIIAAFFDVDNTLINIKSMFSFMDYLEKECPLLTVQVKTHKIKMRELFGNNVARENINKFYYTFFQGMDVDEVACLGVGWYERVSLSDDFYIKETVSRLESHLRKSEIVVFVSGSFSALLDPIAKELSVKEIISTELEVVNNRYTGKIIGETTIGEGKYIKMLGYSSNKKIDLDSSYAYADDISDIQMLSVVGFPRIINPDSAVLDQISKHIRNGIEFLVI